MLTMSLINHIRDLSNCGNRISEISVKTGTDPKNIRKYLDQEDFSPAQVDFGEADFYEAGKLCRKKYLMVSFPYSNDGYSQVFGGETAKCVCQGLLDIFEFIGGVPPLLIFDNAAGAGRRVGDVIHESELFSRFRTAGFSSQLSLLRVQSNCDRTFFCIPSASMLPVSAAY